MLSLVSISLRSFLNFCESFMLRKVKVFLLDFSNALNITVIFTFCLRSGQKKKCPKKTIFRKISLSSEK